MNSVPTDFWEWTATLQTYERFSLLVVGVFAIVFIVTIVAGTIYKMHKNRLADTLKRELVDRGMTADEIATVISAKPGKRGSPVRTR